MGEMEFVERFTRIDENTVRVRGDGRRSHDVERTLDVRHSLEER